ncbi:MAG TPA: hypothetical protein VMB50_08915 [Myxococcales bacterium]|nr:hypothetical protein [Myxococcales bacterium]
MGITLAARAAGPVCALLVAAIAAASPAAPAGTDGSDGELAGAKLIDSVVAIVGRRVITLSQLRTEARVALAEHGSPEAAGGTLTDAVMSSTLDYVISEDLVEEEAARLGVFPVTAADCLVAEESLAARFSNRQAFDGFLARFDIDPERLTAILRRGLRSRRYLENRLRLQIQVTDREVGALLVRAATDPTLPRAPSLARAYLQRQKYQALAAKLVQDLRARADVRILASFGASAGLGALPGMPDEGSGQSSALLDPVRRDAAP